jgi:hypothetical protein
MPNGPDAALINGRDWRKSTAICLAIALICVAWSVYRPDRGRPLSLLDFSEFIPPVAAESNLIDRFAALLDYYGGQGRLNVISLATIAVKWTAFGWWSPGWQLLRAAMMTLVFLLCYLLLRRLGASRLGGVVGSSVYLWSPPAIEGWVRLTMGEPLGTALMLLVSIRMTNFQASVRWKRDVAIAAAGAVGIIWTKELMAPAVLLPLVLGLTMDAKGAFSPPRLSARNLALVLAVGAASILALIPVAIVYLTASDSAYASLYGQSIQFFPTLIAAWVGTLVPMKVLTLPVNPIWAGGLISFMVVVVLGWTVALTRPVTQHRARWLLGIATLVPMCGVFAYVPNPWYVDFYSIPYLIGAAIILGMAATWLASDTATRRLVVSGAACLMGVGVTSAAPYAARAEAYQRRDESIIVQLSTGIDSAWFAMPRPPQQDWLGTGPAMRRVAMVRELSWPIVRKVTCDEASRNRHSGTHVTIDLDGACKLEGDTTIARYYKRPNLRTFKLARDSAFANMLFLPPRRGN